MMQGQLKISVQDSDYTVEQGNFIDFQANCDHRYENTGEEMVIAIMFISYSP